MNVILILIYCSHLLSNSNATQPISVCSDTHPFRLTENKCVNFTDICIKQDDQCNQLQNACKQCPPEKILLSKIIEIWKIAKICLISLLVTITAAIIIIIILLMKIKYRITYRSTNTGKYQLMRICRKNSTNIEINDSKINEITNSIKMIEEKLYSKFLKFDQQIQFQIEEENRPIILNISTTDIVVRVKRQICNKWSKAGSNYYKIMKLKYKETILDDNDYLLSCICDDDVIYCIIDYYMVADDIVVVHVDGIPKCDTELIQLNKNDTIDHVKNIVHKLYNCKNINIYQKCANSEKFTKLEDCKTVGNYQLKDNDVIKIVEIQNGRVTISTIFDEKYLGYFDFTNTDLVSDIYEKIRKQERSEDFILSLYNQYLDREYFLFQYNIDHETEIKYLQFNKLDCLKERKEITSENKSRMFKAKDNFIDREIFVKKYKFPKENDYSNLLRELNTFRTIKSHQRFVQLFAAYKERNEFYISMEYFARGSLKNILSNKVERQKIESKDMVKWCKQILEGINYLNNRGIIHGNLTTSSVLLDENNDVKLSSFGMSKYVMGTRIVYWCYWIPVNALSNVYRAPEIINKKPFGIRVDVWSFGIILGDIITGQTDPSKIMEKLNTDFTEIIFEEVPSQKYEEKSINETSEDYKESLLENYTKNKLENPERNLTNNFINIHEKIISKQLKEIIGKCLIEDPIERISVKELINNYFIKLN